MVKSPRRPAWLFMLPLALALSACTAPEGELVEFDDTTAGQEQQTEPTGTDDAQEPFVEDLVAVAEAKADRALTRIDDLEASIERMNNAVTNSSTDQQQVENAAALAREAIARADRALSVAEEASSRALQAAEAARAAAATAQRAALAAQQASEQAGLANERSDRIFRKTLRK